MTSRWFVVCGALAATLVSGRASAAPAASTGAAGASQIVQVVTIEVAGEYAAVSRTRTVASELLARLGVASIVISSDDGPTGSAQRTALVRAYFDLRDPTQPSLVVAEGEGEREILRRDLPESASLEVSVEELSHVLYAVVEALLRERPQAPPAPQAAAPEPVRSVVKPAPRPPSKPPRPVARAGAELAAGAFFRVLELGSSRLIPGGGAALAARSSEGTVAPGATLLAAAHGSTPVSHDVATAGVRTFSLRLYPTLNVATATDLSFVAGLGGGIDWFRVERERTPAEALPGVSSVLDMTLSSMLGARFQLGEGLSLDAAFSLDLDLTPHSFVVESEGERSTLLELGRLRPGATFGASYSLSGASSRARGGNP